MTEARSERRLIFIAKICKNSLRVKMAIIKSNIYLAHRKIKMISLHHRVILKRAGGIVVL